LNFPLGPSFSFFSFFFITDQKDTGFPLIFPLQTFRPDLFLPFTHSRRLAELTWIEKLPAAAGPLPLICFAMEVFGLSPSFFFDVVLLYFLWFLF